MPPPLSYLYCRNVDGGQLCVSSGIHEQALSAQVVNFMDFFKAFSQLASCLIDMIIYL